MENKQIIRKGELMEELLRQYFLNAGYYVVRGIKYRYETNDITDVDIFLYSRASSITRQRINVDIKNKKTPQVFERILWANGLRYLLGFDSCIVATTDRRTVIHKFGQLHKTIILDGQFLEKIRSTSYPDRLTEEELTLKFSKFKSLNVFNKDWRYIYEEAKSKLISEQDFSGFNSQLYYIGYFLNKVITDPNKREEATRLVYLIISHLLITIDFIIKDIAFLSQAEKEKRLSEGFKYGNLGKDGVDKIISVAVQLSGNKSAHHVLKSLDNIPTDILKDFFSKNENASNLFHWAKDFEKYGFNLSFINPENIDTSLKAVLSMLLDYYNLDRKNFYSLFPKGIQTSIQLENKASERKA